MQEPMITPRTLWNLGRGRVPGQLIIQMTDRCNAQCPQCGMRAQNKYDRKTLSSDDILRTIDSAVEKGFEVLSFTGGEPLLMLDELCGYIQHAGSAGIQYIRTGTNGYHFKSPESPSWESRVKRVADALAATPVRNFWISVDSADAETHERMRGFKGLMEGIERAIPIFHERGIFPSANLGLNRNVGGPKTWDLVQAQGESESDYLARFHAAFEESMHAFYQRVIDMGFTMVNCCYPMSVDEVADPNALSAVYQATSTDRIVRFTDGERAAIFKAVFETVPKFRSKVRIFSPRTSLYTLYKHYAEGQQAPYGCRGGVDFFFVDSRDGNTYPCGYRANDNMGRFWELDTTKARAASCTDCDWECFRDPSELAGPVLQGLRNPLGLLGNFMQDPRYYRLWVEDLKYYRACNYFNGRSPINPALITPFTPRYHAPLETRPLAA